MVNERRPSRDGKGSPRSPRKSPKGNFRPPPLNIKKARPFHGHTQNSENKVHPGDDGDIYDEERFSRTDIALAIAGEQIYEHGVAIHSTLEGHLSDSSNVDAQRDVSSHLQYSQWPTPPLSPTLSISPLIPVSPRFEGNKIKYLERTLKNLEVTTLFDFDKKFHELMWNLAGIREWWTANRKNWNRQKEILRANQVTLNSLITQMNAAESSQSWDKHLRLKDMCVQQKKSIQTNENWFAENVYLMKLVMIQFERLKAKTRDLEAIISQRVVESKWVAPEGFSFGTSPPGDMEMYTTYWFSRKGLRWWLVNAAGHLKHCIQEHEVTKQSELEMKGRIQEKVDRLSADLAALKRAEREQPTPGRDMYFQGDSTKDRKKDITAKDVVLQQLKSELYIHDFTARRADIFSGRDTSIRDIVSDVLNATEGKSEAVLLTSMDFANALYYVCAVQGLSTQIQAEQQKLFADDVLQTSDKREIINFYQAREQTKESLQYRKLLEDTLYKADLFRSDLKEAKIAIHYQYKTLEQTLELAQKLHRRRETGDQQPYRTSRENTAGAMKNPTPPIVKQQPEAWAGVKTYEQAVSILGRRNTHPLQEPGWYLRSFFVSPDVAPHFQRLEKISKHKFLELANTFPQQNFAIDEIAAFLIYCTFVGDLFSVSGNYVSTYSRGWELVDEMPIDATPRSVEFTKPSGLDDLLTWLVYNQDRNKLVGPSRNTTEAQLLSLIRVRYFAGEHMTLQKLQRILRWFDKSGVLFRYTGESNQYREPILRRIDSGWKAIDVKIPYDAIFKPNKPEPYFSPLTSIIKREDVSILLREAYQGGRLTTEWEVYNLLKPHLQIKRIVGMANIIITRHRFHLYLRWCDQKGDGMGLRRDGTISHLPGARGGGTFF